MSWGFVAFLYVAFFAIAYVVIVGIENLIEGE